MEILKFLFDSPLTIIAISSIVNTIFIWQSFSDTRKLRKIQTDPRIKVELENFQDYSMIFELVITNSGKGVAKNIKFEFDGDDNYLVDNDHPAKSVRNLEIIKHGLKEMSPRKQFRYALIKSNENKNEKVLLNPFCKPWLFKVSYQTVFNENKKETFEIRFPTI